MKTDGPVRPADHRRLCGVLAVSSRHYWLDRYKRIMFPSSKLIISFLYSFMKWPDSPDDFRHSREDAIKINIILGLPHDSFWRRGFSMCSCNCIFQCLFWNGKLLIFLVPIGTQLPLNCWKKVFPRCRHPQFLKMWKLN